MISRLGGNSCDDVAWRQTATLPCLLTPTDWNGGDRGSRGQPPLSFGGGIHPPRLFTLHDDCAHYISLTAFVVQIVCAAKGCQSTE